MGVETCKVERGFIMSAQSGHGFYVAYYRFFYPSIMRNMIFIFDCFYNSNQWEQNMGNSFVGLGIYCLTMTMTMEMKIFILTINVQIALCRIKCHI